MNVPNIFRIASRTGYGPEDRFTASLHYLIDSFPSIGQSIADYIADQSGIARSTFLRAHDHPAGDEASRPDFLLECADYDLLCEHKLDSGLGERQLERYLDLPARKLTYLVFITNSSQHVAPDVVINPRYLRPGNSLVPYFTWDAIYPLIAERSERLACEFAQYMRDLEMAPPALPSGWEHLFVDPEVANAFFDGTREARAFFQNAGGRCKADPSRLGFQVRYPAPWMHLLYFCVERVPNSIFGVDSGPYLTVRLYVRDTECDVIRRFRGKLGPWATPFGMIRGVAHDDQRARWDKSLCLTFECIHELAPLLAEEAAATRQRLLEVARSVFQHLSILGAHAQ